MLSFRENAKENYDVISGEIEKDYFGWEPSCYPFLLFLCTILWGHLKELVYRDVVASESELVARLHAAITFVNTDLLQRVQLSIPKRLNACLEMRGGHFEHLPI